MTTNHPIDPSTPRAGWLATVELNTGTKKTRFFVDRDEAQEWVTTLMIRHGFLRTTGTLEKV